MRGNTKSIIDSESSMNISGDSAMALMGGRSNYSNSNNYYISDEMQEIIRLPKEIEG